MTTVYTKKAPRGFEMVKTRDVFEQPLTSSEEEFSDEGSQEAEKYENAGKNKKDRKRRKEKMPQNNDDNVEEAGPSTSQENAETENKPSTSKQEKKEGEAAKTEGAEQDSEAEEPIGALATGFAALQVAYNAIKGYVFNE